MEVNKNTIGQVFFALSILMLIYMLINPLTQVLTNINEYFTLTIINFPIGDLIHIAAGDTNPPLYYLLLKGIEKLTEILGLNSTFYLLKVFSVIPYAVIILISTTIIRKDYGWFTAGLFAFSIAAMSEFFISFTLLRPYSWAVLFTLLTFIYFTKIIETQNQKSYVLFTLFAVLASYTHYFAVITSLVLYILLIYKNRENIKYTAISLACAFAAYLPWIFTMFNLLGSMNPIGEVNTDSLIQVLAGFAYSGDTFFSIITLIIFAAIALIYFNRTKRDEKVIYAIITYFTSVIIAVLISVLIKPLFVPNAFLLASVILWFAIAVMISKLKPERIFLISLALIALLLISGVGAILSDSSYQDGEKLDKRLDKILGDDDSIVIITSPGAAMYLLELNHDADVYCVDSDYIYGENTDMIHEIFDFKDINPDDITSLVSNNTDKKIYLISWNGDSLDLNISKVINKKDIYIQKVNTSSYTNEAYYY